MSLLNAILGAAGQMSAEYRRLFADRILLPDETIVAAFKNLLDSFDFTDSRVVFEDIRGITGKKRNLLSVPYNRIQAISVETAGTLDTDGEIRLWVSGYSEGANQQYGLIKREVRGGVDVYLIQQILSERIMERTPTIPPMPPPPDDPMPQSTPKPSAAPRQPIGWDDSEAFRRRARGR